MWGFECSELTVSMSKDNDHVSRMKPSDFMMANPTKKASILARICGPTNMQMLEKALNLAIPLCTLHNLGTAWRTFKYLQKFVQRT